MQISTQNLDRSFGQFGLFWSFRWQTKWLWVRIPLQSVKVMLVQETDKTKTSNAIDISIENLSKQHDNSRKLSNEMKRPLQINREEENETEKFLEDNV